MFGSIWKDPQDSKFEPYKEEDLKIDLDDDDAEGDEEQEGSEKDNKPKSRYRIWWPADPR